MTVQVITSPFPPPPSFPSSNPHDIVFNDIPHHCQPFGNHIAYIDGISGKRWTREEFKDRSERAARAIYAERMDGGLGLGRKREWKEEIVGILSPNCMEYPTIVHALMILGVPFALYPTYASPHELVHCIRLSKATKIFAHASLYPKALDAAHIVGIPNTEVVILEGGTKIGVLDLPGVIKKAKIPAKEEFKPREVKKDDLAYLVFSSGTSGLPKAVMISYGNITTVIGQIIRLFEVSLKRRAAFGLTNPIPQMITLAALPMYHVYGYCLYMFRVFIVGQTIVIVPKWSTSHVLSLIPKYKITSLPLIPSIISQILSHPQFTHSKERDLSSVLTLNSAAAYLPRELGDKIKTRFGPRDLTIPFEVTQGYGLSECSLASFQSYPLPLEGTPPTESPPYETYPGMEVLLLSSLEPAVSAGVGEPGELFLKGPNVALGYWQNPEATKETFGWEFEGAGGGWMRTGDRFVRDSKGFIYFVDRIKDILKINGLQVSPTELEDLLLHHPKEYISDCAVAGVTPPPPLNSASREVHLRSREENSVAVDEKVPRAWVVLTENGRKVGRGAVKEELEGWVEQRAARHKWLNGGIEFVDEIPKNATGKTLRRVLQERYERARKKKSRL